jgi:hypothetical protein
MTLEMKKACEKCGRPLSADAEAYVCSFECTFCRDCSASLSSICPNCGGELVRRSSAGQVNRAINDET